MSAIPTAVRNTVLDRANGLCEGCGAATNLELHHRKFRSRGGQHSASNIIALCGWGNHTGCHGKAHSANPPEGWAVHSWDHPAIEPVALHRGRVLLHDDGTEEIGLAVF